MLKIGDLMARDVLTVAPELSLRDLVGVLTQHRVTGAPVVTNDRVLGVVSGTDLIEFEGEHPGVPTDREGARPDADWGEPETWEEGEAPPSVYFSQIWEPQEVDTLERMEEPDQPEWDILEQHTVGEIMSRKVISLPSSASVTKAARLMLEADVHRILVMDDSRLAGILTTTDIVRAVAEGKLKG